MLLRDLFKLRNKPAGEIVQFLQDRGMLARVYICPKCEKEMVLRTDESISDKYRWRCTKCNIMRSIRRGSWFYNSNLPLFNILILTYFWAKRFGEIHAEEEIPCSKHTVGDWYNFCREVCVEIVAVERGQTGGPGKIVEIDQSKFGKRKYHRGKHVEEQWVFGGVERDTKQGFLTIVDDRSAATLIPLIKEHIAPETTIVSNRWKPSKCLGEEGYQDLTVNHSLTFKDLDTGTSLWSCVRQKLLQSIHSQILFPTCLGEFLWRRLRADSADIFEAFLQDIVHVYPPASNNVDTGEDDMQEEFLHDNMDMPNGSEV